MVTPISMVYSDSMSSKDLTTALSSIFRLDQFRPLQREVVECALSGQSALVLMPTGFGKSLTYQMPAVMMEGMTLVVSPLKALMKDQVDKLRDLGIEATFINSDLRREEREARQKRVMQSKVKILYVTPERFRKTDFLSAIEDVKIALFVVDEAHCISQWGHDFRPEYAKVGEWRRYLEGPPVLALTATATTEVKEDILKNLGISQESIFSLPMSRPNLAIRVHDIYGFENKVKKAREYLRESASGSKILYFSLIQTLQKFSQTLKQNQILHEVYHGDLPERQRRQAQERFLRGESELILATPAFGLGVDKPDVRLVMHVEVPGSIEAYFQEIGRAGRDGAPAQCALLYDQEDVSIQMEFVKWSNPDAAFIKRVFELIERNPERVRQEGTEFLREQMNFYNKRDFRVETAVNLLRSWGALEEWQTTGENGEAFVLSDEDREQRRRRQNEKLLSMVRFIGIESCRMQYIQKYFSEKDSGPCGICDNCQMRKTSICGKTSP